MCPEKAVMTLLSQRAWRGLWPDGWSAQLASLLLAWSLLPSIFLHTAATGIFPKHQPDRVSHT